MKRIEYPKIVETLPDTARVWIYQSNKPFENQTLLNEQVLAFTTNWTSHNRALKAQGAVYFNQFIVFIVDESQAGASGCSIDKSVHFIKEIEKAHGVDLFNRMNFTYKDGETIKTANSFEFKQLYADGLINDETIVFNNLVNTKADLDTKWQISLKDSWHKRFV